MLDLLGLLLYQAAWTPSPESVSATQNWEMEWLIRSPSMVATLAFGSGLWIVSSGRLGSRRYRTSSMLLPHRQKGPAAIHRVMLAADDLSRKNDRLWDRLHHGETAAGIGLFRVLVAILRYLLDPLI